MEGVGAGVIQGGYGFVIAAYSITAVVLGGYWIHLLSRDRAGRRGDRRP